MDRLIDRLIWVPILIVWVIIGFILFLPYAWLAGGVYDGSLSTVMIIAAPAVILAFVILIFGRRALNKKERRGFLAAFWILLTIVNLPIVMRFISIGLRTLNYVAVADFVFKYRFRSILVAIIVVVLVTMIRTCKLLEKLGKKPELQS